tara:strand:+ start:1634 stop:1909 length:276 start_codon:yes stop_codon:yes gene_type:complete
MSSIFGGGGSPPPPDTSALDDRESLAEKNEGRERKKIASRSRSRRNSGVKEVMTAREDGTDFEGNDPLDETLGIKKAGVRNPRAVTKSKLG